MNIWKRIQRWILGPQVESIEVERLPGWHRYKLTIFWDNGSKWGVRGESTVWHRYPSGERLPTWLEAMCCDAVVTHRWMEENA